VVGLAHPCGAGFCTSTRSELRDHLGCLGGNFAYQYTLVIPTRECVLQSEVRITNRSHYCYTFLIGTICQSTQTENHMQNEVSVTVFKIQKSSFILFMCCVSRGRTV